MTQTPTRFSCNKCKSRICFSCFSKSKEAISSHCSHCGQENKIINKRKIL
jgi:transcription elongation factor Elf1